MFLQNPKHTPRDLDTVGHLARGDVSALLRARQAVDTLRNVLRELGRDDDLFARDDNGDDDDLSARDDNGGDDDDLSARDDGDGDDDVGGPVSRGLDARCHKKPGGCKGKKGKGKGKKGGKGKKKDADANTSKKTTTTDTTTDTNTDTT